MDETAALSRHHAAPPPGRACRGWVLGLLLTIYTFGFIDRMIVAVLGQPIKTELGLSDLQLGLMGGLAFAVFNAVLSIPVARLAERANRVTIISIGVALWSAATVLCGGVRNFTQLMLARLGVGIGEAVVPAATSVISDYYPRERRASAISIYLLAVPLGAFLGAALGAWIAQHFGWRSAFVAAGAPGILLAAVLWLTVREPLRGRHDGPGEVGQAPPAFGAVLKRMIARRSLLHFIAASSFASAAGYGINYFLAPYFFRRFGLALAHAGLLAGLISAIPGIFSILAGGFLADRCARQDARAYAWVPGAGVVLTTPLYIASFLQGSWPLAVGLLMVTGLLQYAYIPVGSAMTQNMMSPRMRASAAAIYSLITNLIGLGLGPLLMGFLSDYYARRSYAAGSFELDCAAAQAPGAACLQASAIGVQWGAMSCALLYLAAAVHYLFAAKTVRQDLAP
ncbi:MAG: MFS transporter [Gammaproteobacteria bacterium]|nr:MFS transporter [Gammaproteobacteria bacterium]